MSKISEEIITGLKEFADFMEKKNETVPQQNPKEEINERTLRLKNEYQEFYCDYGGSD